jgi:hypothetical protein
MVGHAAVGDPAGEERHGAYRCHRPEQGEHRRHRGGFEHEFRQQEIAQNRQPATHHHRQEFVELWIKVRKKRAISAARQTAWTDKLLNPPRCGGKLEGIAGLRSAERCLRSLSTQISSIAMNCTMKVPRKG